MEVEVQLGASDESHIIRCIEYWDIERKRYPQYDHTAVLVAEDITSRFLNVISLFNGTIPIVAIQMNAFRIEDRVTLTFTTVVDVMPLGLVDDDEEFQEITDRSYWEQRGTQTTVNMANDILNIAKDIDPLLELKYNKFYIGFTRYGRLHNFGFLRPQKNALKVEFRMKQSDELEALLENSGIDLIDYRSSQGTYRIRLIKEDFERNREILCSLIKQSYDFFSGT